MRGWLIGAALLLAGCVEDHLTACDDGTACPAGRVCDPAHHGCAAPDQLTACAGTVDGAACHTAEFDGVCFGGVCLVPGCGNRVVEAGEQCDDGNHAGGDGCSADCRSDEQCGNGVLDGALGEACDDGNLASHDGCNSRCQLESPQWTIDPAMLHDVPSTSAFDAAQGTLVLVGGRVTWLWDGVAWHTPSALVPAVDSWISAAYDADRMRIVAIGKRGSEFVVAEWDGTQWTEVAQTGTPPVTAIVATVYDPLQHAVVWISTTQYGYLRAGAWTLVDLVPFTPAAPVHAAFDAMHGTVLVDGTVPAQTWILDGTTWTSAPAALPTGTAHALVYDGDRHQVLSIGALDSSGSGRPEVYAWTGTAWTDTGARIPPRGNAVTWWDDARHAVGIAGGTSSGTQLADVMELAGTTVTPHPIVQPTATGPLGYDIARDVLVQSDLATGTYVWSGSWQKVSPAHVSNAAVLVYDPVRTAMLAYDGGNVLELDTGWRTIASATSTPAVTYDFARKGVVSVVAAGAYLLPSIGTSTLTSIAAAPPHDALAAAYDPDTRDIVGVTTTGLVELSGTQWTTSAFAPTGSYAMVSALQTASIVFVPEDGNAGSQLWERRAGAFREIGQLPFSGTFAGAVERGRGRLVIELSEPVGTVFLERQLTSSLADETCAATDDADGDGAAGCADPDCWQTCGPACPVATSCP